MEHNVNLLTENIRNFFRRAAAYAATRIAQNKEVTAAEPSVTSNLQWHEDVNMLDFLQTVGIHARVNTMLNRERCVFASQRSLF